MQVYNSKRTSGSPKKIILFALFACSMAIPSAISTSIEVMDLNNAGVSALNSRNYKLAIEKFSTALKLEPTSKLVLENLSVSYNNQGIDTGNPKESLSCFSKALYYSPQDKNTEQNLINTMKNVGLDPNDFNVRINLAQEASKAKDFVSAFVHLAAALKIKDDAATREILKKTQSSIALSVPANEAILLSAQSAALTNEASATPPPAASVESHDTSNAATKPDSETQSKAQQEIRADKSVSKSKMLTRAQAQVYLLNLINKDRVANKLTPVELDEVASTAGQLHAEECARRRRLSHWSSDGRKPPQRYTEAGGNDYVMENGFGVRDLPSSYVIASPQEIDSKELDECHESMMSEKPPNDGHLRNILEPSHTHVGLGFCSLKEKEFPEITVCYVAEEFITRKGTYSQLPTKLVRGVANEFAGTLQPGYVFDGLHIYKEPLPKPVNPPPEGGYTVATDYVMSVFPNRPLPESHVSVDGQNFKGSFTPGADWKPALYYVYIWAKPPNGQKSIVVSLKVLPLK